MKLYVEGIGLRGPGLADWPGAAAVLRAELPYEPSDVVLVSSMLLPVAERRRAIETVKLAMAIGDEATIQAGRTPEDLASVFSSSSGDGVTITAILEALATEEREVSPTRFHNSVHNAPSGYWSIATQSRAPSTTLCAHDFSFGAGLLEAAAIALAEDRPVLMVCYDRPYPAVLDDKRLIGSVFGVALVLSPRQSPASLTSIGISLTQGDAPETSMALPALESLRTGNPAARSLPLLAALAGGGEQEVSLRHMAGNVLTLRIGAR